MKKQFFALLLVLTALLCTVPTTAALGSVSTSPADLILNDNANLNCVPGIGADYKPSQSYLYANEKGGVTLVQYVGDWQEQKIAVAEFDKNLDFLNCRCLPTEGLTKWLGFCAGAEYNYVLYNVEGYHRYDAFRVDRYDKNWNLVNTKTHIVNNTTQFVTNDLDVVEANGKLYIITNHILPGGHQATMRLVLNAETLDVTLSQTGVDTFDGFVSHAFMPEIVVSGNMIYTFDRADFNPGPGLFVTIFSGGLDGRGTMRGPFAFGNNWTDWGSLGNAIPGPDSSALAAFTHGVNYNTNYTTNHDVFVLHIKGANMGTSLRIPTDYVPGTPYIVSAGGASGFVLWNPDRYSKEGLPSDDLYYAYYAVNSGAVAVSTPLKAEGHALSDCEPIAFNGGVIWFTVEKGELSFHYLKGNAAPTKKISHRFVPVEGRAPTCTQPGLTEGTECIYCGEIGAVQQEIPVIPHTETTVPGRAPTCSQVGLKEGKECSVCGTVLQKGEEIPTIPHIEEDVPGCEPTCLGTGRTDGKRCTVCGEFTVKQEVIPALGHTELVYDGVPPTCVQEGHTEHIYCTVCHRLLVGSEPIPRLPHTPVEVPARAGTCLEEGRTEGVECSVCGTVLSGCEPTSLGDHEGVTTAAVPPTASCTGLTGGTKCKLCDEQLAGGEMIPALVMDVVSSTVTGDTLNLRAALKYGGYHLVCAFYDAEDTMLGVDATIVWARRNGSAERDNEAIYDVSFTLPHGSASSEIFVLDLDGVCEYAPLCEPRGGLIQYPKE